MPFCSLTEVEVVERFKDTFLTNKQLKEAEDLQYFYKLLPSMTVNNIANITDKLVKFGKINFKARILAYREAVVNEVNHDTALEQMVEFSAYACNDKLFAELNTDRYCFCPTIGDDSLDEVAAGDVATKAAIKLYGEALAAQGYSFKECIVDEWEYVGKGTETYTEYVFRYNCLGNLATLKVVGYGDELIVSNEPVRAVEPQPEPKKKSNLWVLPVMLVAVAAIVVGIVLLTLK